MSKVLSLAEVSEHTTNKDCWLLIGGKVYDVTKFLDDHPGGDEVLLQSTGKDATDDFEDVGHSSTARAMLDEYYVGDIDSSTIPSKASTTYAPPKQAQLNQDKSSGFLIKLLQILIVWPDDTVELFRNLILAGEIMRRHSGTAFPQPDFFVLLHHTFDKVMKDNMDRFQQSLDCLLHPRAEPSPRERGGVLARAGQRNDHERSTAYHHYHHNHQSNQHEEICSRKPTAYDHNHNSNNITCDKGSSYREMFYESWEEMRRRLEHEREGSPLEIQRPISELVVVRRALPCLRKAGSGRRKLDLKVSFSSPIIIPGSQRRTPVHNREYLSISV
ncbi:hypothetical protein SASPL_124535 [Salvia splendens]|uniref:Cytochrome b5 heme-binding domain-containing protein n=1 Tax=Salvia splendens TaxID=180675 RepID=A0A8X8ZNZ8_SALSN|nr:hypothetical protein SASPL_124535 [Salvia splendens]